MTEFNPRYSPLDDIRVFAHNASAHDVVKTDEPLIYTAMTETEIYRAMYENLPILDQEVVALGKAVHVGERVVERGFATKLHVNPRDENVQVRGIYRKLRVIAAVMGGKVVNRVVHSLETTTPETRINDEFNEEVTRTYVNVCAENCRLFPVEPVNAHSIDDIEADEFPAVYDYIMSEPEGDDFGGVDKVKEIGNYLNILLEREGYTVSSMNQQRISWLAEQGLLEGREIVARNFVLGDIRIGESMKRQYFSDPAQSTTIVAGKFTVAEGYARPGGTRKQVLVEPFKELYVRGMADENPVTVAVKNIVDIR